jgi:PIN domain nuclease of toxin-antitoxin system
MKNLLLDSNALLFYLSNSSRIGKRTRQLLFDADLFFSPISFVELKIKALQGKLRAPNIDSKELTKLGFEVLNFQVEDVASFDLAANADPFDNMLLAQAKSRSVKFLTADLKILALDLDFVLDLTD